MDSVVWDDDLQDFVDVNAPTNPVSKPEWQPDEDAPECNSCMKPFSFMFRRHHCRACGQIFCYECSNYRFPIPQMGYSGEQRVCLQCYTSLKDAISASKQKARKQKERFDEDILTIQFKVRDTEGFAFNKQ